jgi:hypothetical protein
MLETVSATSRLLPVLMLVACGDRTPAPPPPTAMPSPPQGARVLDAGRTEWLVPSGWKSETIPFPLDFAKTITHTGVEELRFPPGFFKPDAPDYWSYAFVWRTDDAARLDATGLADELTRYFRGLIAAVDESKHQVKAPERIVATVHGTGPRFDLAAEVFDAFGKGQPVSLTGWAERHDCGAGALWIFVLAPATTSIRSQLDELATAARSTCPT